MTITPRPDQIEQIVARVFEEFGVTIDDLDDLGETILIHDGQYFARSYRAEGLLAMWFVEDGFIQFYNADGAMLRTVNLLQELSERRLAA